MASINSGNQIAFNSSNITKISSTSISTTTSEQIIQLENRLPIMTIFISLYALIFFFGITGNALVVCKYYISSFLI
jgi:cellobiose-specific phosphotransferase system component IIC